MVLILLVVAALSGGAVVESQHYGECKDAKFKGEPCQIEQQLCYLGPDTSGCSK